MGFLEYETSRVDLGGGYWADLREMDSGQYGWCEKVLINPQATQHGITASPDVGEFRRRLVCSSIADWNLTDENDQPLPLAPREVRRKSVDRLPPWAFEMLRAEADRLSAPRKGQDAATFHSPGESGVEGERPGSAGDGAVLDGAGDVAPPGPAA